MTKAPTFDMPLRDTPAPHAVKPASAATSAILAERPFGFAALMLIGLGFWVLTHSYPGILGDANLYIGRALADLDPSGVGRDMVFVHDGQSRFSIFPLLLDHLVAWLGTSSTGLLLAILAMAAWIGALLTFASRYVAKPFIPLILIVVALLPISYGAPQRFIYSEVITVPRPFAEALVLLALALLARKHTGAGFAALILASLIHPIMALAGWAVFAFVLSIEHRRWAIVFAALGLLVIAGAFVGLPVLHRLVTVMDAGLKAFALGRSPHLFPSTWPTRYLGFVCAEAASLLIAASFAEGRARLILIGALAAGVLGILAQIVFGDFLSLLLVIQGQLWRMVWLVAALGAVALGICAVTLWTQGARGQMILALLALAWLSGDMPESAAIAGGVALILHFARDRIALPSARKIAIFLWAFTVLFGAALTYSYLMGYAGFVAHMPPGMSPGIGFLWTKRYLAFFVLALILPLAFSRRAPLLIGAGLSIAGLCLCMFAAHNWDGRDALQRQSKSAEHPAELAQAIAGRPGEILWIDGRAESWRLAGRPEWASAQQGVSTIFSADLARLWQPRMQFLIDHNLADKKDMVTGEVPSAAELPRVTAANRAVLCKRPDAPAWIVAPFGPDFIIPPGLAAHEWRPPQPSFKLTEGPDGYGWERIDGYAVIACAGAVPSGAVP
jgi:hypothetical protein